MQTVFTFVVSHDTVSHCTCRDVRVVMRVIKIMFSTNTRNTTEYPTMLSAARTMCSSFSVRQYQEDTHSMRATTGTELKILGRHASVFSLESHRFLQILRSTKSVCGHTHRRVCCCLTRTACSWFCSVQSLRLYLEQSTHPS